MRPVHRSIARCLAVACAAAGPLTLSANRAAAQVTTSGVGYAQYLYQLSDSAAHLNNFDISRAYVNVGARLAGNVATRVTSDIYRNTDGSLALRLKYAFVTWMPGEHSPLTFKMGQMQTPFVDWEEALWDYRMQGTMAVERNGYMSSSDFGAGMDGKWQADRLNMQIGLYNGENYNRAPGDKGKDFMARASYRVLSTDDGTRVGGLRVTGYAQLGSPTSGGQRRRIIGMVSYRSTDYTLAAEYVSTTDSLTGSGVVAPVAHRTGRVISAFGVFHLPRTRWAAVARVDVTDPSTSAATDKTTRIIGGVSYQVTPNLRLLADIDRLNYQSGHTVTPAEQAVRTQGLFQIQFTF